MFRCVTKLRGLIIDIDTFNEPIEQWDFFLENYHCCFLTFKKETERLLEEKCSGAIIVYEPKYTYVFAPGPGIHEKALKVLNLLTSEVAYISKNINFIENALCFLSGTIWIKQGSFTYENAGKYPDIVFDSLLELKDGLKNQMNGYFGEVTISPDAEVKKGYCIPVLFKVDGQETVLFSLGRYFGYSHYMHQLHPYSAAIFWNKKQSSRAYGAFNARFAGLFSKLVQHIKNSLRVDCICHVPVRPGDDNRFKEMTEIIARDNQIKNISDRFTCVRDYGTQKGLTEAERRENIRGVFEYSGNLKGQNVVLIDDIITTGATVSECIRTLKKADVANVSVVVLAINQIERTYWSSNQPNVICPRCGNKMRLMINSQKRIFFYSCFECKNTSGYESGRSQLIETVNQEFL